MVKNAFGLRRALGHHMLFDQVCVIVSRFFNGVEDFSNHSESVLQTDVAKSTSSITRGGIETQMKYVSRQSCLLDYGNHRIACFPILPPCIGLR